jgi:hypothetical protein
MLRDTICDDDDDEQDQDDEERHSLALSFPMGKEFFVHWLENETTQQWMTRHDNDSDNESISAQSNDSLKYYHRKKKGSSSDEKCSALSNTSSSKSV